jgi:ATP synthase F1 gamma subunit
MISSNQLKQEFEGLSSLEGLVQVYEEVAAGRMQKVRGAVLQSRLFLYGLLEVFSKVKRAYKKYSKKVISSRPLNGKTVAVFVSANSGLYGDIVDKTFETFAQYVKKNDVEIVVLGKLGLQMLKDKLPDKLFNYYDFVDEGVEAGSFQVIMRYLLQFEKILVFYGQFKSILVQSPVMTSVSGDADLATAGTGGTEENGEERKYLFEPSVEKIAEVFDGEILASVFEQTLHESQLAKFASRMIALDKSEENIQKRLTKIRNEQMALAHAAQNRKQLSTISGLSLWSNGY